MRPQSYDSSTALLPSSLQGCDMYCTTILRRAFVVTLPIKTHTVISLRPLLTGSESARHGEIWVYNDSCPLVSRTNSIGA